MKKLIIANWKMNPQTLAESRELLELSNEYLSTQGDAVTISLVICPPFVFTEEVGKILSMDSISWPARLGAQDIFWEDQGSDTGEISGPMLAKLGVSHIIVGHSERRWKLGESPEEVHKKLQAVIRNDMIPIVCIGEKERDENFKTFIKEQILETFKDIEKEIVRSCVIAYEPVWAISSNAGAQADTPENASESIEAIREILRAEYGVEDATILYGGSVNSKNIISFLSHSGIDGVLVGSASVKKDEWRKLLMECASLQ